MAAELVLSFFVGTTSDIARAGGVAAALACDVGVAAQGLCVAHNVSIVGLEVLASGACVARANGVAAYRHGGASDGS